MYKPHFCISFLQVTLYHLLRPKSTSPAEQFKPRTLKKFKNLAFPTSALHFHTSRALWLWALPCAGVMRIGTQTTQNLGSSPPRWHGVMGIVTQTTQKSGASPFGGTWCFFFQLEGWAFIPSHHSRSSTQGKTPAVPHVGAKTNPKPLPLEKKNSNLSINLRLRLTSVVVQRVPEELGGHHRPLHEDGLPFADAPGGEQAFPLRGKKTWFRGAREKGPHTPKRTPSFELFTPKPSPPGHGEAGSHPPEAAPGLLPLYQRGSARAVVAAGGLKGPKEES